MDPQYTDKVPSPTQMGKVYARLIESVNEEDNLLATIRRVYDAPICDVIDDYNTSAYYEPATCRHAPY